MKKRKPSLQPKKKRERVAPVGSGRYNLTDEGWDSIFQERMEKEAKNKKKVNNNSNSKQVRSSAASSTVTSGALESLTSVPCSPLSSFTAPVSDDNSNPRSGSTAASSSVASEAVDSDLPDIPDPTVSNTLLGATSATSKGKRKRGSNNNNNNTGKKLAKPRSTEVKSPTSTAMEFGPSVPKFPLDSGVLPLIDDKDEDDNSNCNNNTENMGSVVPKIQTFLDDMNLDLETDHHEVKKSRATQQSSKMSESVSNNSTKNKNPRASGGLSSRVNFNTNVTSPITSSKSSTAISTASLSVDPTSATFSNIVTNNNILMGSSKTPSNSVSQASVPITIIEDGDEIKDQNIKSVNVIPSMKLKAVKYAKVNIKKKNDSKKKR